ncbi:MAG: hypothetical protein KDA75_17255 [Planctomycetaceae bacterium]|nr:hypothetical protein [Planctomycetaceae bacterium]
MKRTVLALVAAVAAFVATSNSAFAQATDSDTQTFTVTVAPVLSITAPVNSTGNTVNPTIAHDGTDSNQTFANQVWSAACNNAAGAALSFVITPFANGTNKRNATLAASVASSDTGSGWAVSGASTATTDHTAATPNGTVNFGSNASGDATFNIGVTFIDSNYSLLPAGSYVATVTGTIQAN